MLINTNITEASGNLFKVKKFVDGLSLIDSGVIHCVSDTIITIMLDNFSLNFRIVKDPSEKRRLKLSNESTDTITLDFVNFNENLGAGVLKPTSLFRINGVEIYFTFFIRSLDENQKEFTYSLLSKV